MNLLRCESFARELHSMLQQVDKFQEDLDKVTGYLELADGMNELEQAKNFTQGVAQLSLAVQKATTVVLGKANKPDLTSARQLVTDLSARIDATVKAHTEWRIAKAEFEYYATAGTDFDRPAVEQQVSQLQRVYELREKLTSDLIPDKAVVLRPKPALVA